MRSSEPSGKSTDNVRSELVSAVRSLARGARGVYCYQAILQWLTISAIVVAALAAADAMVRAEELGIRILSSLLCLIAVVGSAIWRIRPAWRFTPTNLDMAKGIEQVQPGLRGSLSSVVEIAELPSHDHRFGSIAFRDVQLRRWQLGGQGIHWNTLLDTSPVWRAAGIFAAIVLGLMLVASSRPAESGQAMKRLLAPWSPMHWPRADQLRMLGPPGIVLFGSQLLVEVVDSNAPLPPKVDLQVRRVAGAHAGNPSFDTIDMRVLDSVAVASISSIREPIEIRAVGGDDSGMAWQRIDVASPPEMKEYVFRIEPPSYTGDPVRELVGNRIEVIENSRVSFTGTFSEPVKHVDAIVQVGHNSSRESNDGPEETVNPWHVDFDSPGTRVSLLGHGAEPWVADRTARWRLRVTTVDDLEILDSTVWEVQVKRDTPPSVSLNSFGSVAVSPQVGLRIRGEANDDLGLRDIAVAWKVSDTAVASSGQLLLWSAIPSGDVQGSRSAPTNSVSEKRIDIDTEFMLAKQITVSIGQRVSLWLEAHDNRGQLGRSQPQQLEIKASEDVLAAVEASQSKVLEQLQQLAQLERRNAELGARIEAILGRSRAVRREDLDSLTSVAQLQNSIQQGLHGSSTSVAAAVESMLDQLRRNGLEDSDDGRELTRLASEIERVSSRALTAATESTRMAVDAARTAMDGKSTSIEAARDVAKQSTAKLEAAQVELDALSKALSGSEAVRQLQRDLAQVLNRQQEIRRETDQLDVDRAGGNSGADQQAARTGLWSDQQGLARSVDELLTRSKKITEAAANEQSGVQQAAESARQSLIQSQVSRSMRAAAEHLNDDRYSEASATQRDIAENLRKALRELNPPSNHSLDDALAETNQAVKALSELAGDQAKLAEDMRSAAGQGKDKTQSMADEQASLKTATAELGERLEPTGSEANSLQSTIKDQNQAEERARAGAMQSAAKKAEEAAAKLDEAKNRAQSRAQELAQELAQEQLLRLDAVLAELVRQQELLVTDLEVLSRQLEQQSPQATDPEPELHKVRQLSTRQEAIRQMTRDARERAGQIPAFDWAFEEIDRDMQRAVAAIIRKRLRPEAEFAAGDALRKLQVAADALHNRDPKSQSSSQPGNEKSQDESKGNSSLPNSPPVASLKLMRGLQADLNAKTKALNEQQDAGDAAQNAARLQQLAVQQRSLGMKLQELLKEIAQPAAKETR